jgi:hypothetical protein
VTNPVATIYDATNKYTVSLELDNLFTEVTVVEDPSVEGRLPRKINGV